ncbi:unnamed protein product [Rodentolepis nana]|uniref:Ovule protein n=1 Tax=Rodentolepis nana TaxID=102285 RepID=A0A0R3TZM8_RODNA|nr:unnamed protein product [Rodentolepis nana]
MRSSSRGLKYFCILYSPFHFLEVRIRSRLLSGEHDEVHSPTPTIPPQQFQYLSHLYPKFCYTKAEGLSSPLNWLVLYINL